MTSKLIGGVSGRKSTGVINRTWNETGDEVDAQPVALDKDAAQQSLAHPQP